MYIWQMHKAQRFEADADADTDGDLMSIPSIHAVVSELRAAAM